MTDDAIWFAFFGFQRYSDGLIITGACCPLVSDASVKILRSQGFLEMHQTCILKGY
jgi:hypothetical protein